MEKEVVMSIVKNHRPYRLRSAPCLALIGAALFTACISDEQGLFSPTMIGTSGMAGQGPSDAAGSSAMAGAKGEDNPGGAGGFAGQDDADSAGSATGGTLAMGGSNEPTGGTEPAAGGSAEQGGQMGEGGVHIAAACPYHSEPAVSEAGAGGADAAPSITVQVSPFIGSYLADAAGRALYTTGGDLAGDCNLPPQSLCTADCLVSWPAFDAGPRVLPDTLTDAGFGTIERPDGSHQTTYLGWPLYYYKADLLLGQMTGQGKGKTWHVAEVRLPSVMIMKAGTLKYLADSAGRTLYVSAADQVGTAEADPVSTCAGACLATFEGFKESNLSAVTSLEPLDFSTFVRRGAGGLQVAYKGMPLYRAATDLKSGDMNGLAVAGFTAALP
jgi:predicted lipoprotein with Yx(FWY)xxD motif